MLHHPALVLGELKVHLAREIVVAAFGNVEPVVVVIESHATVHKSSSQVIIAGPGGLVAWDVGCCKEE